MRGFGLVSSQYLWAYLRAGSRGDVGKSNAPFKAEKCGESRKNLEGQSLPSVEKKDVGAYPSGMGMWPINFDFMNTGHLDDSGKNLKNLAYFVDLIGTLLSRSC